MLAADAARGAEPEIAMAVAEGRADVAIHQSVGAGIVRDPARACIQAVHACAVPA